MLKAQRFNILVIGALALPTAARADIPACDSMTMPVVELKSVGRGVSRYHPGIDLMAPYGSPVQAAASGVVTYAGRYYAYGNIVDISHADGSVTRYAHLSRFAAGVRPGTNVAGGQVIGAIGTTGNAHGAHLHFEVRVNGAPIDPKPMIHLANCVRGEPVAPVLQVRAGYIDARPGGLYE